MKIRCLAIDDEPFALKQMADYIEKTPFLQLAGQCNNAFEAMELMASQIVDLVFVDINMPEMSGMEFVKAQTPPPNCVFTTAYSEYAVESYDVNAIDYLLKPITYSDFMRAANKARTQLQSTPDEDGDARLRKHFFVKSEGRLVKIKVDEIEYIESLSEYVKIHLTEQKSVVTLMSLKSMEASLPPTQFMRVHRSFIVNLNKITTIERNRIVFKKEVYIPVSEQYKNEFKAFLNQHFL